MTSTCWKTLASDCVRRALWISLSLVMALLFVAPTHARVSPAHGADPGRPAGPQRTPAPSATFGIGPGDSVFDGGGAIPGGL